MLEVKTILNPELVRRFNTEQAHAKMWLPLAFAVVFIGTGAIGWVAGAWGVAIGLLLIAVGAIVPAAFSLVTKLWMQKILRAYAARGSNLTQTWRFLPDEMICNEASGFGKAHDTHFAYEDLKSVTERETAFYLSFGGSQSFILDVKGIRTGSRFDLHTFLINKVGKAKYKYSKKLYAKK